MHIAVGFVWLTTFAWLVSRMHAVIVRPRVKAALERVTGAVLIALGLRVALEKRSSASLRRVSDQPDPPEVYLWDQTRRLPRMGVIKRKRIWKEHAGMQQHDEELLERALRFVDTRGVVMRTAEAELRAAIADQRAHPTPERERRVEEARRALEEAKSHLGA